MGCTGERGRVPGDEINELLLFEGKVYAQTVPAVQVVENVQPKPAVHVVVLARPTIHDTH